MNVSFINGTVNVAANQQTMSRITIVVALCISINYINGTLIHTFRKHQIFYLNPRYILFIHLVINDMVQLSLSTLLFISYSMFSLTVPPCLVLLIISIMTTFNTPINLAVMAVECYIAVCLPLHHVQICTVKKTYTGIGLIWVASAFSVLPDIVILVATQPLHFFHSQVLCERENVFRNTYSLNKRDTLNIICLVLVWLTLLYTYFKILFAAKGASANFKKARNTILLHGFHASYFIVNVLPRLMSPLVYGLRDQTFRRHAKQYLLCKVISTCPEKVIK
ncbi:odorant receptor 131-2-like [Mastacembelus armatus]|nr:odorant receptor 131-2-like [Mastacembelus armatus]